MIVRDSTTGLDSFIPIGGRPTFDPQAPYKPHEMDDEGTIRYYGFLAIDSSWIIQKEDSVNKSFRYAAGVSGFSTAWTNRASYGYDYIDKVYQA